jgi:hypothetical protein
MARDLPTLEALLVEILAALGGGTNSILARGDWPVGALAFDGHHLLLVRDHGHSVTLSLPKDQSWALQTRAEWNAAKDQIQKAVSAYRERHPGDVSIADVIVALDPVVWPPNFPGTPVPAEAWIESKAEPPGKVGLFQKEKGVLVVVWVGTQMRSQPVSSPDGLRTLAAWLRPQLAAQRKAADAEAAEEARKKALPVPKLEAVLSLLRSGKRMSTGGGRYYETFFVSEGKLRCEVFDEGYSDVRDATEEELRSSIEQYPDRFRAAP